MPFPSRASGCGGRRGAQRRGGGGVARPARRDGHAHRRAADDRRGANGCARQACGSNWADTVPETLLGADLIVLSPGVPPATAGDRARRARAGVAGDGRARAGLALAARPHRRDHRDQGKVDDHDADRRMLEAGGHRVLVGGNIGLALSAQVDASTDDTIHVVEASSFQLESDRHLPSVDRGADELFARPSRSPCRRGGIRGRPRPASSRTRDRATGRCSTPTTWRRVAIAVTRAAGG